MNNTNDEIYIDEVDKLITIVEVREAIKSLKRNNGSGQDNFDTVFVNEV